MSFVVRTGRESFEGRRTSVSLYFVRVLVPSLRRFFLKPGSYVRGESPYVVLGGLEAGTRREKEATDGEHVGFEFGALRVTAEIARFLPPTRLVSHSEC